MRRGLVNLCLVLLFSVVGATEATAAVTVSRGGTLDVAGTAASETVTLTAAGDTITVASPQGVEGACGEGPEVVCAVDANVTVRAELGGGEDTLDAATLDRAVAVRATDGADTVTTGAGGDSIVLEGEHNEVHAGGGRDVVAATGVIRGDGGDDFLTGDGDLDGGPGDDSLEAILGATVAGGDGIDSVRFTLTGPVRISLDGEANDGALLYTSDVHADVEVLRGGAVDDVLVGADGAQELEGGPGADRLDGGPGADVLRGGEGDDELDGGTARSTTPTAAPARHRPGRRGRSDQRVRAGRGRPDADARRRLRPRRRRRTRPRRRSLRPFSTRSRSRSRRSPPRRRSTRRPSCACR